MSEDAVPWYPLKKIWTTGQTALQRFNTAFLRDTDKLNEFKIALNNRFQALQDLLKEEETTMEDNWQGIKEAPTLTCQEVLGLKKHHHKEWISIETLDRVKERKNKKTAINKIITNSIRYNSYSRLKFQTWKIKVFLISFCLWSSKD
ncbi:unnamed protein product [Schistosoma curassoni]|uniref:Protein Daple n=1 Tax=Schistosoma curassoni TaxID=6186 RepID=A0A183KCX5_9TREM|nr:unnamed protein product [Schistosoma curassoni]